MSDTKMHCSAVATAHPLRASWRSIRNKIRICRRTQYDLIQTYFSGNNRQQQSAATTLAVRPRFVTNAVEQQIYTILVIFLDQVVECYHTMYNIWVCKKFGRQLARILRAINFDHGYCWRLLENRILYYLMVKHYSTSVLLAWHTFIDTLSDAVIEGFWQATTADLPKQLPTIFEDTPAKCFLFIEPSRPSFFVRLLNLFVRLRRKSSNSSKDRSRGRNGRIAETTQSKGLSWIGKPNSQKCGNVNFSFLTFLSCLFYRIFYRVLYAYKPRNADELELQENDIVFVIEKCDDGWFIGTLPRTGQFGTFPGNYVERIEL
uniref:SH3 domain-containing protein n=1 Tax=Elaeophora elaphi TaxID=1147741 RepID=A0A0R3RWQ6_9BILA